jgi:hypothetical protein
MNAARQWVSVAGPVEEGIAGGDEEIGGSYSNF